MRRERELPVHDSPTVNYKVRMLDDSKVPKSVIVPLSKLTQSGGRGGYSGYAYLITDPETPTESVFYVCAENGLYTNFNNQTASQFDEFHYNVSTGAWDLIPYSSMIAEEQKTAGARMYDDGNAIQVQRWTGTAWVNTGFEMPY